MHESRAIHELNMHGKNTSFVYDKVIPGISHLCVTQMNEALTLDFVDPKGQRSVKQFISRR